MPHKMNPPACRRPVRRGVFALALLLLLLPIQAAEDTAARYSSGSEGPTRWLTGGHRGDSDFGMWTLEASPNGGAAGHFIGDSTLGGGDVNSAGKSFAMFANPAGQPLPEAGAVRKFAKPALTTGDTISFKLAVNYRNGSKGFTLRDGSASSRWNFTIGKVDGANDGYYIRNAPSGSPFDNGQRLGAYHGNTVFTFTFTQRERQLDWTATRSGGITSTVTGSLPVNSGTIADIRFFISGTDAGGLPQNNLYFNTLTFNTETRGDLPLTLGERRLPGFLPSFYLRFTDPQATAVTMRHAGDNFTNSFPLTKGEDGVWAVDVRTLGLAPGWHEFKFRLNSEFETGANRFLYIDPQGRLAKPPAVYLTWQRDPTTTMTVHWHSDTAAHNTLRYRVPGATAWTTLTASTQQAPFTERLVHTAEIIGLNPGWVYEFQVDGHADAFTFQTMPARLDQPLTFAVAGDVEVTSDADAMASAIAAKNPAFIVIGGDLAYADAMPEKSWKWDRYFQSWFTNARTTDRRLIPMVVGIGNHEVRYGWSEFHPDFTNTADWKLRYAPEFYRFFAFPGLNGYNTLDFGDYLALIILDTEHSNPTITGSDPQTQWLSQALLSRRNLPHLLPIYHIPAYPSARSFDDARNKRIRDHWVPLFQNAGVHLAFEFHDHTFKRTKALLNGQEHSDGIVFAGDGAWGVDLRTPDPDQSFYATAPQSRHHAFLVTLTQQSRRIQAVDKSGTVFDDFTQGIDGTPATPDSRISDLSPNTISLAWQPVPNARNYLIFQNGNEIAATTSTSLTLTNINPQDGATYQLRAGNRSGFSSPASISPRPRQLWRLANNLPWDGSGPGGDFADPDHNGLVHLQEYFFGLTPGSPEAARATTPFLDPSTNRFGIRYRKNPAATDTTHRVLRKLDLADPLAEWTPVPVLDELEATHSGTEIRRATIPRDPNTPHTFLKLEVAPAP